jgi:hypothetical protein
MRYTGYEFKKMLKEKFIFCYSCPTMNYLRHHDIMYICKGVHEISGNPFWLFLRDEFTEKLLKQYIEDKNRKDEILDVEL